MTNPHRDIAWIQEHSYIHAVELIWVTFLHVRMLWTCTWWDELSSPGLVYNIVLWHFYYPNTTCMWILSILGSVGIYMYYETIVLHEVASVTLHFWVTQVSSRCSGWEYYLFVLLSSTLNKQLPHSWLLYQGSPYRYNADKAKPDLSLPCGHGWEMDNGQLNVDWTEVS